MIGLELLREIEAFKGLDDNQLVAVQKCTEKIEFQRGDRLFAEGADANHLWIVLDGEVILRYDRSEGRPNSSADPISFISEAELFGWSSFMPPYQYRLSAYCASRRCEVVKIAKDRLAKLFEKDNRIGFVMMSYILRVIGTHFYQFRDEIAKRWGHDIMSGW
ncbi:MAG: cyclic nucleotide-binding domain-containing protein [Desulfobacterales bacterium]|nr:MAG: cyclic nucleotide-binding domain-containing protein [Desulfobacterales bacterium]